MKLPASAASLIVKELLMTKTWFYNREECTLAVTLSCQIGFTLLQEALSEDSRMRRVHISHPHFLKHKGLVSIGTFYKTFLNRYFNKKIYLRYCFKTRLYTNCQSNIMGFNASTSNWTIIALVAK